jgi:hypothetical protein
MIWSGFALKALIAKGFIENSQVNAYYGNNSDMQLLRYRKNLEHSVKNLHVKNGRKEKNELCVGNYEKTNLDQIREYQRLYQIRKGKKNGI